MKKVRHLPWYVKHTILAVLSIIFVSPAAYSQKPTASELIKDGTLNVPYTLSDGTVLPSPEAAQMRRYMDHPVALNTGVLSVNIPLYTMSVGGYSLPIALSYHAAGIKADDEHCETGLGWSLLGGGCISRSVIGVPDEQAKSEAYNDDDINTSLLVKALHYTADTWYDRYSYSFAGYSGSFIIQGNSIQQLPQTDLTIAFCDNREEGVRNFCITTPDGDRYYFTEREHTRYNYRRRTYQTTVKNDKSYEAVTAWHLSRIITANMKTAFYKAVSDKGMRMLPVMEKYISDDNDTVIVRNDYDEFGTNGSVFPSLSRITHRGTEVARQEFLDYDCRGNLLATRINSGVPTSYMWDTEASLPVAAIKGGIVTADQKAAEAALSSDSVLVTRYAYKPLVGCTAISYPNTRTVSYGYDGGRLSTISDTGGNVVKSYDYAIYSETNLKGCNSVTEHTYTSAGKGTSVTTSTYYDSFGCPVNVVAKGASTDSRDLATLTEYDALDRTVKEWLAVPYSAANGPISQCDFLGNSSSEYDDSLAFRESQYELSPSAEAVRILQPGVAFSKRPYTTSFVGNRQSDAMYRCQRFVPSNDYTFRTLGSYADGELAVVKTVDADNRTVLTFTDWKGNKVLERHVLDGSRGFTADTYYVYDALGKLRFVLPPALDGMKETCGNSWDIRSCVPLRQYAYFYRYDNRMLLVEKKLPGADPVYYINDITGNTVFSQDGNLRKGNRWNFSIPDRFGRTAVEGLCDAPDAAAVKGMFVRVAKTDYANAASSICSTGYCPNIVLQAPSLLTADYYDDYRFLTLRQFEGLNRMGSRNARGLKTGTMTAVLKPVILYLSYPTDKSKATPSEICSVVSYDSEDRIACVETSNILGGKDRTVTEYTFSGKPLSMAVTHTAAGKLTAEESYGYTYDALDRPLQTRYSINNGQSVTLADNRYDELGRLQSDRRNGSASLATEYSYNLHGMPTRISTPLYTESLFYEQPHNGSTPQYGGNISAIDWSVADESDTYGKRGYTFSYDGMSRLTAAGYLENGKLNNHFSTSYKYDIMGNILSLRREGLLDSGDYGTIDDLTYSYEGNQVVKIDDAADESPNYSGAMHFRDAANEETEYTYDANGNMLTDSNKGITSIDYNVLDLPQCIKTRPRIIFKENADNAIYYTYSADGTKLRAKYKEADSRPMSNKPNAFKNKIELNIKTNGMVTSMPRSLESNYYYCSNLVYNDDRLSTILFDGGYASVDEEDGIVMHYYVKDHLGSNRLVVDGNGNIEEVNHYYPFGALMGDRCGVSRNKYKYIGKELDTMYGWNMQDHEARWYDPVLGRWMATDPLQEKYESFSTYYYANNNPLVFIDFNGKDGVRIVDEDNKTLTIKADYFVITAAQQYRDNNIINVFKGYSSKDIEKMNSYNEYLSND